MNTLSHKAKQYGWFALKVFVLFLAFRYIYLRIWNEPEAWQFSLNTLLDVRNLPILVLVVFLSACNWAFEGLKWQLLVKTLMPFTYINSLKQTLAALTASLATPNRIGEYGAKAYFFESKYRKKILLLTFFGNGFQMGITCIFGIIGFFLGYETLQISINFKVILGLTLVIAVMILMVILLRNKEVFIKGLSLSSIIGKFKEIALIIHVKVGALALLRYFAFSLQYVILLRLFGANIEMSELLPLVFLMYFLASVVPMLSFLDVVVKGSIAVWIFSSLGMNPLPIAAATLTAWLFNLVIPTILGSFHLLKSPPQ